MQRKIINNNFIYKLACFLFLIVFAVCVESNAQETVKQDPVEKEVLHLPKLREKVTLTFAPDVQPPITRNEQAVVEVHLQSTVKRMTIKPGVEYDYWTFNDHVPGPFIRARIGDTLEVHHTNTDASGMPHNVDFHAVTGPGGGAPVTTVVKGERRVSWFKLLHPGLFIYHCAAPPVMDHIANGMYGLILVEPEEGLPRVDKEFYVLQSEIYGEFQKSDTEVEVSKDDFWEEESTEKKEESGLLIFSHQKGLDEHPKYVFFNGVYGKHLGEGALKANVGEKVRIFFGNIGPNLISSFHVIGEIFDNVYREADLISPPGHSIQTTLVPAGGATVVEFDLEVPGTFTLVDHAIFRVEKGAVGYLEVEGKPNYDIFASDQDAVICPGCLVHP
jgi:copper-containing nitrite reductase